MSLFDKYPELKEIIDTPLHNDTTIVSEEK